MFDLLATLYKVQDVLIIIVLSEISAIVILKTMLKIFSEKEVR